jgi:hypothetical protein
MFGIYKKMSHAAKHFFKQKPNEGVKNELVTTSIFGF